MLMLALELSTRRGSVALAHAGPQFQLLDEVDWESPQAQSERVFGAIEQILGRRSLKIHEIGVFAAGRGPGGFSGIRIGITAIQALALPLGRRVMAVSSGRALAHDLRERHPGRPVAVVGDARRERWWWGAFPASGAALHDWRVDEPAHVLERLPAEAVVASPDWDRLGARVGPDGRWIREPRFPRAAAVALLAAEALQTDAPGEPVEPIYLHPPV